MEKNMTNNPFADLLREYLACSGMSLNCLATAAEIDRAYLWRLLNQDGHWIDRPLQGRKYRQPSRDLVMRLALALHLPPDDTDELLMSAGYAPTSWRGKRDCAQ